ncbi:DUF1997 domain-containing protein [Leptolyngbya sp. FACHB-261]|uniref:DUF1997 domain-containing protein n=1 Tax=Leptolyngbya sp. FACHB-261 TaxID=2692806 RepID=UPI001688FCEB|nr:DUF1997 domain-containing protein [Leptolyngbya sp. FACHB-261]MBD2103503.1 DUF1997 domain-containing protein [Leptolyngbya sp. FACHB-261]
MKLRSDPRTVASYLSAHGDWFQRCAKPLATERMSANAYCVSIGRIGALGYELEPKVGLELLPEVNGLYRILSVPLTGCHHTGCESGELVDQGYEVDFKSCFQIQPDSTDCLTCIEWQLDLGVTVQLPRFVQAMPGNLIERTGNQVLYQVVKRISRRLTQKIQEDFHSTIGSAQA